MANEVTITIKGRNLSAPAAEEAKRELKGVGEAAQAASRQTEQAAQSANRALEHTSGGFNMLGHTIASTMGNVAANAISAAASAAVHGVESLVRFGIASAANMQTARVSFDLMLGSAEKAGAFLKQLQAFAVVTPFELQDLQTYAGRLLSVGTNADKIIPMLRHIGDATAAVGTGSFGIERAVNALNEMRLAGDVSLIHLKELAFAGVPIFDALASSLHTTTAKVFEDVSKNKISVDQVFNAIEHGTGSSFARINGMMDKQSATLAGKWSNLKDSAQQTFGHLFEPALPGLSRLVDAVGQGIPKAIEAGKKAWHSLQDEVKGTEAWDKFSTSVKDLAEKAVPFLKKQFDDLVQTVRENKDGLEKFGKLIADLAPLIGLVLAGAIVVAVVGLEMMVATTALIGKAWDALKGPLGSVAKFIITTVIGALVALLGAAVIAFGWIPGLGPKLKAAQNELSNFVNNANRLIDNIVNDVNVTIHVRTVGSLSSHVGVTANAHGGITGAASGGIRNRWTMVGEHGIELLQLPPGTGVKSNPDTERMLSGAGMGGVGSGRGAQIIEVRFTGDTDSFMAIAFRKMLNNGLIAIESKHILGS